MKKVKLLLSSALLVTFIVLLPSQVKAGFAWDHCCYRHSGNQYIGFIEIVECWYLGSQCGSWSGCTGCY